MEFIGDGTSDNNPNFDNEYCIVKILIKKSAGHLPGTLYILQTVVINSSNIEGKKP